MTEQTQTEKPPEPEFLILAESSAKPKPLLQTNLSFGRLMDEVVVPYETGDPFFVDGAPVTREGLVRVLIAQQERSFNAAMAHLHECLRIQRPLILRIPISEFEILRPRPVPPNFLVVELSACENFSKTFAWFSFEIPIPVSDTLT